MFFDTILDPSIFFMNTKKKKILHSFPRIERSEKFLKNTVVRTSSGRRPDDLRTTAFFQKKLSAI